jgi:hypothetical protein
MKITTQNLKQVPAILITIVIAIGAFMKLAGVSELREIYSKMSLLPLMRILAVSELLFISMYLYRTTMRIGLLLLTAYFGGAMAVELSHGPNFMLPAAILSTVWIGAYLRDPYLFRLDKKQHQLNRPALSKTMNEAI